jgi:hypothetical protein
MKRALLTIVLAAGSLWAGSPFAGRWQGKLEGLPGATLNVKEDQGKLSGSIVFYLIRKDDKGTRVDGEANCELLEVAAKGKHMTFEVKHHVTHDSPEYGPNVKFFFELAGDKEGVLRNVPDGLSVRMLREP